MKKQTHMNLFTFFLGLLTAFVLMIVFSPNQESQADDYSCIKSGLTAYRTDGNIPNPTFTLDYKIPTCLKTAGYRIASAEMLGGITVKVNYEKRN